MNDIEDVIVLLLRNEVNKAKDAVKSLKNEDNYVKKYISLIEIFIEENFDRCNEVMSSWGNVTLKDSELRDRYFCIQQVLKLMTFKALKETKNFANTMNEITSSNSINSIYSSKFQEYFESTSKTVQKPKRNSQKLPQNDELENFIKLYQEITNLTSGSKCFIISSTWIKKYFRKIGITDASKYPYLPLTNFIDPNSSSDLGDISNECILEDSSKDQLDPKNKFFRALKPGLKENLDFLIVSENCFNFLSKKYNFKETIQRNVAENRQHETFVEIYLKTVSVTYWLRSKVVLKTHLVSRFEPISEIVKLVLSNLGKKQNEIDNVQVWKLNRDSFPLNELESFINKRKDEFIENCTKIELKTSIELSLISETDYLFFDYSKDKRTFSIKNSKGSCFQCKNDENSIICLGCKQIFCTKCIKKHKANNLSCKTDTKRRSSFGIFSCFCGKSKNLHSSEVKNIKSKALGKVRQESDSMIESQTASQDIEKKNPTKVGQELETTSSTLTQSQNAFNLNPIGLQNLGNTCFMNSALQCLLNCEHLSKFLLTVNLSSIINKSNLLGTKGKLAISYFELLKEIVSGKDRTVAPWNLKNTVGKYAVQFAGYSQQDSHEFFGYLISGLHEDLKEPIKKPLNNNEVKYKNDQETADESWQQFIKTNKSMIVDLFYGQYKSTLSCPKCNKKSITFDPFNSISLPIPGTTIKTLEVPFVKYAWHEGVFKVSSPAGNKCTVLDFKTQVCEKLEKDLTGIRIFEMKYRVPFKEVNYSEGISKVRDNPIWFFEVPEDIEAFCFVVISVEKSAEEFPCRMVAISQNDTFESLLDKIGDAMKPVMKLLYGDNSKTNFSVSSYSNQFIECIECNNTRCDKLCKIKPSSKSLSSFVSKNKNLYLKVSIPLYTKSPQILKLKEFKSIKSSNEGLNIQDCFSAFSNPEKLDKNNSWKCPHCKNHVEATKKMEIFKVPNILIIHLKRFKSSGMYREKINSAVSFPKENLDIRDYVLGHDPGLYDLFAVSNHFGTLAGGHYTATVLNSLRGKWFECNDSSVSETDNISESASYLLFYRAKSSRKVGNSI